MSLQTFIIMHIRLVQSGLASRLNRLIRLALRAHKGSAPSTKLPRFAPEWTADEHKAPEWTPFPGHVWAAVVGMVWLNTGRGQ
jgi:hypothetical protein